MTRHDQSAMAVSATNNCENRFVANRGFFFSDAKLSGIRREFDGECAGGERIEIKKETKDHEIRFDVTKSEYADDFVNDLKYCLRKVRRLLTDSKRGFNDSTIDKFFNEPVIVKKFTPKTRYQKIRDGNIGKDTFRELLKFRDVLQRYTPHPVLNTLEILEPFYLERMWNSIFPSFALLKRASHLAFVNQIAWAVFPIEYVDFYFSFHRICQNMIAFKPRGRISYLPHGVLER